jgi:hypothetical protein
MPRVTDYPRQYAGCLGVEESLGEGGRQIEVLATETNHYDDGQNGWVLGIDRFGYGEQHSKYQALKVTGVESHGQIGWALLTMR